MKKQLRIALLFLLVFAMLLCSGCGQKTTKRSTQEIIEEMVVDYGSYGEEADQKIKVLLKELQSLALDVRVLKDDGTEVKIIENVDYGDTDMRHIFDDYNDRKYDHNNESFASHGMQVQDENGEAIDENASSDSGDSLDLQEDGYDNSDSPDFELTDDNE